MINNSLRVSVKKQERSTPLTKSQNLMRQFLLKFSVYSKICNRRNSTNSLIHYLILEVEFIIFGGEQVLIGKKLIWSLISYIQPTSLESFSNSTILPTDNYMKLAPL